jgi:Resolvase, N terminal domain
MDSLRRTRQPSQARRSAALNRLTQGLLAPEPLGTTQTAPRGTGLDITSRQTSTSVLTLAPDDVPRPAPSVQVLYPTSKPWNGRIAGLYVRNSRALQIGNDSAAYQTNLLDWLHNQRFAVALYDEQGTSATRGFQAGGQPIAQTMLDDLRAGAITDLAAAALDRFTREYTGMDAALLKQTIWSARARLITPEKTYEVWKLSDEQQYDLTMGIARWDAKSRRNNVYRGMVAAIASRPVFRQRIIYGYRFEYLRNHASDCAVTAVIETAAICAACQAPHVLPTYPCSCPYALDSAGRVTQRWWIRDETAAPYMEALAEAADRYRDQSALLAYMNAHHLPPDWRAQQRKWRRYHLVTLWSNPVTAGKWIAVRHPSEETDVWVQYLDQYGNIADQVHDVPDLAYWTPGQIARWRRTFLDDQPIRRYGAHDHPFLAVLRCITCGQPMHKGGKAGYRCGDYQAAYLPLKRRQCRAPQLLAEQTAERAFLAHLPIAVAELKADADRINRNLSAAPLLDELRNVTEQMTRLRNDWLDVHLPSCPPNCTISHMPKDERIQLASLDADRQQLERQISETTDRRVLSENARELIDLALANPAALTTWRINDADRHARIGETVSVLYKHASIERHGNAKRWSTFSVADYELNPLQL